MKNLNEILKERIVILDGGMGTMIQNHLLDELDYKGDLFSNHPVRLKGNHDILSLTCPGIIKAADTRELTCVPYVDPSSNRNPEVIKSMSRHSNSN